MLKSLFAMFAAVSLIAATVPAQPSASTDPTPPRSRNLEGEAIGYLAIPALLVLVLIVGLLIGSGGDETAESP